MTKRDLLAYPSEPGAADAHQVAVDFGVSYSVAAMRLLRLVRQALAARGVDPRTGRYGYPLSERGYPRLASFQTLEADGTPFTRASESRSPRRSPMRRTKLHTGTYHCPTCVIEFELVGEEHLKCDQCEGPLATGSLDDVWDNDEDDE